MEKREEKEMLTLAPGQINLLALNAGVGSRASFNDAEPDAAELRRILDTNVFGVLNGITTLLPVIKQHQQQQESSNTATTKSSPGEAEAAIVITGSKQGITNPPGSSPAYNASKAALHSWVMNAREQLRQAGYGDGGVRLVEVFPPAVQTELHDEAHQPDLRGGGALGMPLAEFTERAYAGLARGDDQFAVGPAEALLADGGWEHQRQTLFRQQHVAVSEQIAKYLEK